MTNTEIVSVESTVPNIQAPELYELSRGWTVSEMKTQADKIRDIKKAVMKEGVHYGTIPGCGDKPTLLKPGAETLLVTFRISGEPIIEDLSTPDEARYRVNIQAKSIVTQAFLGSGIGECSSHEEKYRWRKAICKEEFDETAEDRKRMKWGRKKDGGTYQIQQVRTNKADLANTVLKMAKKRALVDAALTVTAASDVFTQDLDEMEPELAEAIVGEVVSPTSPTSTPDSMPARKSQTTPTNRPETTESARLSLQSKIAKVGLAKNGTHPNGDKWQIYNIYLPDGKRISTFSKSFGELADRCVKTATVCELVYKEGEYGLELVSLKAAE